MYTCIPNTINIYYITYNCSQRTGKLSNAFGCQLISSCQNGQYRAQPNEWSQSVGPLQGHHRIGKTILFVFLGSFMSWGCSKYTKNEPTQFHGMLTLYSWSLKQNRAISSDFLEAANPRVVVVKLKKWRFFGVVVGLNMLVSWSTLSCVNFPRYRSLTCTELHHRLVGFKLLDPYWRIHTRWRHTLNDKTPDKCNVSPWKPSKKTQCNRFITMCLKDFLWWLNFSRATGFS